MLTIGNMIDELEKCNSQATVKGVIPDGGSYRGFYDQFYIERGDGVGVAELVRFLNGIVGQVFEGYKGGSYTMDRDSICFVATYGSTGLSIGGVTVDPNSGDIILNLETY